MTGDQLDPLHCDICGQEAGATRKILRFNLMREQRLKGGGRTTRGAGTLNLCQRCWETTAMPRMARPQRIVDRRRPIAATRQAAAGRF